MDRYLEQKYKGTYRIKAHYDKSTNDWCRDVNDDYDDSFSDFYIDCKNGIEIKHGVGSILSCYIPSSNRGRNILKQIYIDNFKKDTNKLSIDSICKKLIDDNILIDIDVLDGEVYFTFKNNLIDYIAKLVGAKTSGANVSPFSIRNLPKTHYIIPEKDLIGYKEAIKLLPTITIERNNKDGKNISITIPSGAVINSIMRDFNNIIKDYKGKEYDINKEQRKVGLKGKEFIHSIGLWKSLLEYIVKYKY